MDSGSIELDLRLMYKRFKELYPFSDISYQDYKKLQMQRASRRTGGRFREEQENGQIGE